MEFWTKGNSLRRRQSSDGLLVCSFQRAQAKLAHQHTEDREEPEHRADEKLQLLIHQASQLPQVLSLDARWHSVMADSLLAGSCRWRRQDRSKKKRDSEQREELCTAATRKVAVFSSLSPVCTELDTSRASAVISCSGCRLQLITALALQLSQVAGACWLPLASEPRQGCQLTQSSWAFPCRATCNLASCPASSKPISFSLQREDFASIFPRP